MVYLKPIKRIVDVKFKKLGREVPAELFFFNTNSILITIINVRKRFKLLVSSSVHFKLSHNEAKVYTFLF